MLVKGSSSLPALNLQVVEHPYFKYPMDKRLITTRNQSVAVYPIIYHLKIVNFCKCKYLK